MRLPGGKKERVEALDEKYGGSRIEIGVVGRSEISRYLNQEKISSQLELLLTSSRSTGRCCARSAVAQFPARRVVSSCFQILIPRFL